MKQSIETKFNMTQLFTDATVCYKDYLALAAHISCVTGSNTLCLSKIESSDEIN
jgi:hypothetical protein